MKLSSLIGLSREKRKAHILIRACARSGETFPHTLLHGIGGTGKTALARAIGDELGYYFVETHAAPFKRTELLFQALTESSRKAQHQGRPLLFFIDEIHRLNSALQESLYTAMKEWWLAVTTGKHKIPPFTLFGATTRLDMLDENSFVKRFENNWEIRRYPLEEMAFIVADLLGRAGLRFGGEVSRMIAERCLGIPRIAVNLSNMVRNMALASDSEIITPAHVLSTFELEEIDVLGLHPIHQRYLQILNASLVNGKHTPLGIGAISAKMRQPEDGVKGSVEPILLEMDMVAPTPRGRIITNKGSAYLNRVA